MALLTMARKSGTPSEPTTASGRPLELGVADEVTAGLLVARRRHHALVMAVLRRRGAVDDRAAVVGRAEPVLGHRARLAGAARAGHSVAIAGDDQAGGVHLVERGLDLVVGRTGACKADLGKVRR